MHEGHRQRMTDRFLSEGLMGFEDHEVLELLLFYAIPRKNTNEIAHALLASFGSIANVFEADAENLQKVCGIGKSAAAFLKLVFEASRRYRMDFARTRPRIRTIEDAGNYATELFLGEKLEKIIVICLDMRSNVIHTAVAGEGTIDETPFYPRKIVAEALKQNAAKVILAHNHPGGSPKPSRKDIEITAQALDLLKRLDIDLIDHIIVGRDSYMSMAAQRVLSREMGADAGYAAQYEKDD